MMLFTVDLASHPGRSNRDDHHLAFAGFGITHSGIQLSKVDMLQLHRPSSGKRLIELLARRGKGLLQSV